MWAHYSTADLHEWDTTYRGGFEKWYQTTLLERNKERNEESRREEESTPWENIFDELGDDMSEDMSWSEDTSWSDNSSAGPSLAWPLVFETKTTTAPTINKSEYLHNKGEDNHPNPTFPPLNNDNDRLYLRGKSGSSLQSVPYSGYGRYNFVKMRFLLGTRVPTQATGNTGRCLQDFRYQDF